MNSTNVPYIVHESSMARMERVNRRLWILAILLAVMLVATNAVWIWYESQWQVQETTTTTEAEIEQNADGDGSNFIVGGDYIGSEAESQS